MSRWPINKAYFWERAPFFRLLLPLIGGIILYPSNLSNFIEGEDVVLWGALVFVLLYITTVFIKKKNAFLSSLHFFSLNIVLVACGWILCYHHDVRNNAHWFGNIKADGYAARIMDEPAEKDKTWKLELSVVNAINGKHTQPTTGNVFVYIYKDENEFPFHEGDTILLPSKWQPIKSAGNPFEFDYAKYCSRNNLFYQQFVALDDVMLYNNGSPADITWIRRTHKWCMARLEHYIEDIPALGLIQAVLIGDEANLDPEIRQAYSETGIIHIVAISGSHVTIFFLLITFLLGWIKHNKYHWLKYIIALPLVWAYVLMAGAPPSAIRAALMFSLLAIGFALQKTPNSLNQLLATAFILLCVEPMWLYAVGFQLSFLAVLSLILFYRPIYRWYSATNIITKTLWGTIAASLAVEILVAPLVIYYFHLFPAMFLIANVAAYFFMGIILILGMLIVTCSSVASLAGFLATITISVVGMFNRLVFWFQTQNPVSFRFLDIKTYELIILYLMITGFTVYLMNRKKAGLFSGLSMACILMFSFCVNEFNVLNQNKLVVYNIGKSNHIELIEGKYHTVIHTDTTVSNKKKGYVLKPAHTGWHAWKHKVQVLPEIFQVGNSSVLILNQPVSTTSRFPVDYVVINYPAKPKDMEQVQTVFNPKKIIIGNISRRVAEKWDIQSNYSHIAVHPTILDGAFIAESF